MSSRPTVIIPPATSSSSFESSNDHSISYTSSFEPSVTSPRLASRPEGTFESVSPVSGDSGGGGGGGGTSKRRSLSPAGLPSVPPISNGIGQTAGFGFKPRGGSTSRSTAGGSSSQHFNSTSSPSRSEQQSLLSPSSDSHNSATISIDNGRGRSHPANINTLAEYHSSAQQPQSPIGVHNVNININGVPYGMGVGVAGPGPGTSALMRESGNADGRHSLSKLAEEDFSPISTTFPSRSRTSASRQRSNEPTLGASPSFPPTITSAGTTAKRSARSFMLNPLALPVSRPYLRGISTLILWAVAFYAASTVLLPSDMHQSIHSSITALSPLRLSSTKVLTPSQADIATLSSSYQLSPVFPAPPARPADTYPSPDERYRAYKPLGSPPSPFPRLRKTKMLPRRCLEGWLLNGEMMCSRQELGAEEMLDVTWLWVNGSDTRWQEGLHKWREGQGVISPDHHFRENNELKYSIRSVLAALPGHLRTFHLILADYAFDSAAEDMTLIPHEAVEELEAAALRDPAASARWTKSGKAPTDVSAPKGSRRKRGDLSGRESHAASLIRPGTITVDIGEAPQADHLIHAGNADSERRGRPLKAPTVTDKLTTWLNAAWRVVQTPVWLNFELMDLASPIHPLHKLYAPETGPASHTHVTSHPSLRYASHWEIFHTPTHEKDKDATAEAIGAADWRETRWKEQALPTYNSMAIESRIGWLWGLADVSLSMNDDFFLLREHAVSDFYSPLYGTVIRFDNNYNAQVRPVLDKSQITDPGESGGLFHANWLLSQRFPRRLRPYFAHVPKVITRGLHHEASIMFESALTKAAMRKFREVRTGDGDVQMQWLLTSLRVERWREALLWTWIVARVGTAPQWMAEERGELYEGPTDFWGDDARADVRALFGLSEHDEDVVKIEVHRGERWTLETERVNNVFNNADWDPPKATSMLFSSLDGHLPPLIKNGSPKDGNDKCLFDLDRCFGSFWSREEEVSSDEMFKRLAFVNPACGDCLIMALVTSSGPLGLSSVFPPESATFRHSAEVSRHPDGYLPPPHLPMTPTWAEADFSLENVIAETSLPGEVVDLRLWSMQLMSRYLYMSGTSNSHFHMLVGASHAAGVFKLLDNNRGVSILGMNDDIVFKEYDATRELMLAWFQTRWRKPAVWEKGWSLSIEKEFNDLL